MSPLYTMETYGRLSSNQDMGAHQKNHLDPGFPAENRRISTTSWRQAWCVFIICAVPIIWLIFLTGPKEDAGHIMKFAQDSMESQPPPFFFVARPDNGKPFSSLELFFRWLVGGILHMGHWRTPFLFVWLSIPKCSMYGIFMYIYHKFKPFM